MCLGLEHTTDGTGETGTDASFENMTSNAHDDMTRCNTQENDRATTANNWKTPGSTVSGRHNTPPLREDLLPSSRMVPAGKAEEKEDR